MLALLDAAGAAVEVIDYPGHPPTAAGLARLCDRAGMTLRGGLRPDAPPLHDDAILAATATDPAIIERPLVETALGVRPCRPPERVREILPAE